LGSAVASRISTPQEETLTDHYGTYDTKANRDKYFNEYGKWNSQQRVQRADLDRVLDANDAGGDEWTSAGGYRRMIQSDRANTSASNNGISSPFKTPTITGDTKYSDDLTGSQTGLRLTEK
jgi:hypothetical protein